MPYPFDQIFAADPDNTEMVASNVSVLIFAPGDATKAPLPLTTLNGLPLANPVPVNDKGFGPAFVAELDQVAWEGGAYTGLLASYKGMKDEAVAARLAADESRAIAEEAARNAVVPTTEAIASAITSDGPVKDVISAAVLESTAGIRPDNGGRAVGKGELAINVRDYGARGNGTTDDTPAVQAAMRALETAGGGTLFYPPGQYLQDGAVYLTGNVTITGRGATLLKRTASPDYTFFIGSSGTKKGYGAGPSNITCHGLTFKGSFKAGAKRVACAFSLHHSENVLIYNNVFTEMSGAGHRVDLCGCRNVTIRENTFEGFDPSYPTFLYTEDIQLDFSVNGSPSHTEASSACFDGLATRDVQVTGNKWTSIMVDGVLYPAANPLGSHSAGLGQFHENIYFQDNKIIGPVVEDTTSDHAGVLQFMCPKNLHIEGNLFLNANSITHAVSIVPGVGGIPPAQVGNAGAAWTAFPTPQVAEDVFIRGNTFKGFAHTSTTKDLINIRGHLNGPAYVKRVSVESNRFDGNRANNENVGPNLVYATRVEGLTVANNISGQARRLIFATECRTVNVHQNTLRGVRGFTISVDLSEMVTVQGNLIVGGLAGWEIYITNCTQGSVMGNTITGSPAVEPSIRLTASSKFAVTGNSLTTSFSTGSKGIELIGASSQNLVAGNVVVGYANPVVVTSPATATQANNVTV